jgi:hypothetical protein
MTKKGKEIDKKRRRRQKRLWNETGIPSYKEYYR